ncbi:hypothetical protein [Prosthecodimorpha staleyi]|uniref:Uncharacterized protein n=1 Tax=Prosthecodimorpha staleyi TaxID=2840188 RepID=A0A947D9S9_9HYPH|nr:hypothetical protein [Prosthecodimorpha staleyi]MBT9293213.1 hypothetical protein [Prosthecodimorpha staleyi]
MAVLLAAGAAGLGAETAGAQQFRRTVPGSGGCVLQCSNERLTAGRLDDYSVRRSLNACRDQCEGEIKSRFSTGGQDAAGYADCPETALTEAELGELRAASGPPLVMLSSFVWEVRNVLSGRILRRMEVRHQVPTLNEVVSSTRGFVPPGETGGFVIAELGDVTPQLGQTVRIVRVMACTLK